MKRRTAKRYTKAEMDHIEGLASKGISNIEIAKSCSQQFGTDRTIGAISTYLNRIKREGQEHNILFDNGLDGVIHNCEETLLRPVFEKRSDFIYKAFVNQANAIRQYDALGGTYSDFKGVSFEELRKLPEEKRKIIIDALENNHNYDEFDRNIDLLLVPELRSRDHMKLILPLYTADVEGQPSGLRGDLYTAMKRTFVESNVFKYSGKHARGNWKDLVTYDLFRQHSARNGMLADNMEVELEKYGINVTVQYDSPRFEVLKF